MKGLEIDFETRSDVDLRTCGAYVYFESPHTQPLMASYILNGGKTKRWLPHEPCPAEIRAHVEAGGMVSAHNMAFERGLWQKILTPRYGWPALKLEQCRCTLATASALGLPRSLEKLGEALNLSVQKDKTGKELIRFFCLPRKPDKEIRCRDTEILIARKRGEPLERIAQIEAYWTRIVEEAPMFNEPADFPEKFEQFRTYCDKDVETEAEADRRMIPLSDAEQAIWVLDQQINDRGIRIDVESVAAAINLIEKAKAKLDAEMKVVTGGVVTACSQVAKLTAWVAEQGVILEGMAKDDILKALDLVDLPDHVRKALLIRQEAGKSSTSKLKAFLQRAGADGRARGAFVYHGAAPGRWSSTGVNFGNMPRPRPAFSDAHIDPAQLFEAIRGEDLDYLKLLFGDELGRPLHLISDAVRGFVIAAPGMRFLAADYSNIQGAICAWLADEAWKVQAMNELFADPTLPDLYRRAAAKIMGMTTEVITKKHYLRQSVGKVSELSLQFQGGASAFYSMSLNYNVNLDMLAAPVWEAADEATRNKAVKSYERALKAKDKRKADVLSRGAWIACEIVKVGWRAANPTITASWDLLEDAARKAVLHPGVKQRALGKVDYLCAQGYLFCRLPAGRCIAYPSPKLKDQVWARVLDEDGNWPDQAETMDRDLAERLAVAGKAKIDGACKSKITALGVDSATQKFVRYPLYGGLLMENLCLGIERDILAHGMQNLVKGGYGAPVLHVYDEIVVEVPNDFGSVEEVERLMCDVPLWAHGIPINADGFEAKRYRK